MTLTEATLIFATKLMATTCQVDPSTNQCMPYDHVVMYDTVEAIVATTDNVQEVETLVRIARWESGGFREDIASCKVRGDHGQAQGLFQVHPFSHEEIKLTCSPNYREQVEVALTRVRDSAAICKMHGLKDSDLLTVYTRGSCHHNDPSAHLRWGSGKELQAIVWIDYNVTYSKRPIGYAEAEK